jgi:UPF0716 protein FxsA
MFLLLIIGLPILEVFAFIEVALAIGWPAAILLLLGTSVIGMRVVRVQGRSAIERVSSATFYDRPGPAEAIHGALGFLGGLLLVIPGFITDAFGVLLLLGPTRRLAGRWLSHTYAGRVMRFVAATGRFSGRGRTAYPADVESTAVDDDLDQLEP